MNIIVVGCGKIGTTIVSSLVMEGHDVIAIDDDADAVSQLSNVYDVFCICGSGTDCDVLEEAGVAKAELFVAVTGSDELNMLSCLLAKKMGAKNTIARIRDPEYSEHSVKFMCKQLDLSMAINPELSAARALFNILKMPTAVKIETFSRSDFEMIELRLKENSLLNGVKISDLSSKYKNIKFLISVVQRGKDVYIPDGNFVLQSGDKIGIAAAPADIQKMLRSLNILQKQARNIMILGGSKTAFYLARMLSNIGSSVKIIEKNPEKCRELSDILPKAVVINGDGAQQELLREEGINSVDAFVTLTGMDEENILISIFAATQQVPKVISKVNRDELSSMAEKLGLDCIISPKKIISDILVQYARALKNSLGSNVETLYKVMDEKAEALQFNVKPESKLTNTPLRELRFKPNILIAGIVRDRQTIIPSGDDVILPGDKVIVIAANRRLHDLKDILK